MFIMFNLKTLYMQRSNIIQKKGNSGFWKHSNPFRSHRMTNAPDKILPVKSLRSTYYHLTGVCWLASSLTKAMKRYKLHLLFPLRCEALKFQQRCQIIQIPMIQTLHNDLTDYPLIGDLAHQRPHLLMYFTFQPSEVGEIIFLS